MNQTGSGLGAGFFMSEWKKRTGHKSKYEKSPDSVGKSGLVRNCCRIMIFLTFRNGKLIYQMVINRITILC